MAESKRTELPQNAAAQIAAAHEALVQAETKEAALQTTTTNVLLNVSQSQEDDEIAQLSIEIEENLQSIAESQIRTAKDREEIARLDEEINSLLEAG